MGTYAEHRDKLKSGDAVFFREHGFFPRLIRRATMSEPLGFCGGKAYDEDVGLFSTTPGKNLLSAGVGVRHTRVAGTRRMSLHASGLAVDMAGNPGCIYARLRGWPGGYSTDYARVRHVHISGPGGREDGLRFAHRHAPRRVRLAWR